MRKLACWPVRFAWQPRARVLASLAVGLMACDDLCDQCQAPRTADRCLIADAGLPAVEFHPRDPFPLQPGNWWRYRLREPSTGLDVQPVSSKTYVLEAREGDEARMWVGGDTAGFRYMRLANGRIEWIVRNRINSETGEITKETTHDPGALRLDLSPAHTCEGDTWSETFRYVERALIDGAWVEEAGTQGERWKVVGAHEQVANPLLMRTEEAFCVQRISDPPEGELTPPGATGRYCFAYGIGKFTEHSEAEIELLEDYCVGRPDCCETAPGGPFRMCGPECVDAQRDARHCGGCHQPCGGAEVCLQGVCAATPVRETP